VVKKCKTKHTLGDFGRECSSFIKSDQHFSVKTLQKELEQNSPSTEKKVRMMLLKPSSLTTLH